MGCGICIWCVCLWYMCACVYDVCIGVRMRCVCVYVMCACVCCVCGVLVCIEPLIKPSLQPSSLSTPKILFAYLSHAYQPRQRIQSSVLGYTHLQIFADVSGLLSRIQSSAPPPDTTVVQSLPAQSLTAVPGQGSGSL